jgi:ABC-2 type transport system permease protein
MDRLRTSPLTAGIANRLAGSARVSRIWVKTASEYQEPALRRRCPHVRRDGRARRSDLQRSRVVVEKSLTMVLYALAVGFASFAGVTIGSWIGGLGMDVGNIAATSVLAVLIGLVFGALAMLLSAATGVVRFAIFVPVCADLIFHVMNAIGELNDAAWADWSPFHYYLGSDPLTNGMPWGHGALLAALVVLLLALAVPAFQRRDLRQVS